MAAFLTPADSIPPEIWENVFSSAQDTSWRQTLRALALTSKLFYHIAQRLLFSCITIHPYGYAQARHAGGMWRALSLTHSQVEQTMQRLRFLAQDRLVGALEEVRILPSWSPDVISEEPGWAADDAYTAQILTYFFCELFPKLPRLRRLLLSSVHLEPEYILAMAHPLPRHYSLNIASCSVSKAVLARGIDAEPLPIRELGFSFSWMDMRLPDPYVPSPSPAMLETIRLHQRPVEALQTALLSRLQSLGHFPALSAVQLLDSQEAQDLPDWRPFFARSCPALAELHVDFPYAVVARWGECAVPSLRLFRGSWPSAQLYLAHPHRNLRHLVVSGSIASWEGDSLSARLAEMRETFAQLESLELTTQRAYFNELYQLANVMEICAGCPRLRALRMVGLPDLRRNIEGLFDLPYPRTIQFLSFLTKTLWTKQLENMLTDSLAFFSELVLVRRAAPDLRCVVLEFVPFGKDPDRTKPFAFNPVAAQRIAGSPTIDEWRDAVMREDNVANEGQYTDTTAL